MMWFNCLFERVVDLAAYDLKNDLTNKITIEYSMKLSESEVSINFAGVKSLLPES